MNQLYSVYKRIIKDNHYNIKNYTIPFQNKCKCSPLTFPLIKKKKKPNNRLFSAPGPYRTYSTAAPSGQPRAQATATTIKPQTQPSPATPSATTTPGADFVDPNISPEGYEKTWEEMSKKERLKVMVRHYGRTVIVFHVAISLVSLGVFYGLVSRWVIGVTIGVT